MNAIDIRVVRENSSLSYIVIAKATLLSRVCVKALQGGALPVSDDSLEVR